MKFLFAIFIALSFVGCATSNQGRKVSSMSSYYDPSSLETINLTHMSILDQKGRNTFPYIISPWDGKDAELEKGLLDETGDDFIRSKIFDSRVGETLYMFVFITEKKNRNQPSTFKLNVVLQSTKTKPNRLDLMVDYEIISASKTSLEVMNLSRLSEGRFTVQAEQPLFQF